jgi:hypothetical protein
MNQHPIGPGVEAPGIAQLRQPAPDLDEGGLRRILGQVTITQDPIGDLFEPATAGLRDSCERDLIPPLRSHDESGVHASSVAGT